MIDLLRNCTILYISCIQYTQICIHYTYIYICLYIYMQLYHIYTLSMRNKLTIPTVYILAKEQHVLSSRATVAHGGGTMKWYIHQSFKTNSRSFDSTQVVLRDILNCKNMQLIDHSMGTSTIGPTKQVLQPKNKIMSGKIIHYVHNLILPLHKAR